MLPFQRLYWLSRDTKEHKKLQVEWNGADVAVLRWQLLLMSCGSISLQRCNQGCWSVNRLMAHGGYAYLEAALGADAVLAYMGVSLASSGAKCGVLIWSICCLKWYVPEHVQELHNSVARQDWQWLRDWI